MCLAANVWTGPVGAGAGTGTVTQVNSGTGLTGGPITGTGTLSLVAPVAVANGGSGTISTLTGFLRGGNPFTGAEISGDCTTSASYAITCTKTGGVAFGTGATATIANYCALAGCTMSGNLNGNTPTVLGYLNNVTSDLQAQLNAKAASNATTTVNGQTCALGGTCTIPEQVNTVNMTSQAGINVLNSSVNSVGLAVTISNPATNQIKAEITGNSYTGNAGTASNLNGCVPAAAGDICYWNGSAWTKFAGNGSGTQYLSENAAGVPAWGSGSSGANTALGNLASVGVNLALTPATDNLISLDSATKRFVDGLFSGVVGGTDGAGTKNGGISFPTSGNEVDVGNGTAGNTGGTVKAAVVNASSNMSLGTAPAIGTSTGTMGCTEGASTGLTPVAGADTIRCDATNHGFMISKNGGSEFLSAMNLTEAGGLLALASGGLNADLSAGGGAVNTTGKFVLKQDASHVVTSAAIVAADLPGTLSSGTAITNAALTTPAIGAATGTSLYATGIIDGKATMNVSTTTPCTLGTASTNCSAVSSLGGYTVNEHATAGTAITYNLPTAAAGLQYCVANGYNGSAANTGTLQITPSATGQYIIFTDGTLTTNTTGHVISGGAAGDAACVVGVDTTHWLLYVQRGTWTKT